MDAAGGERDPIVGPDGPGQAELPEGPLEDGTDALALDGEQPPAGQQIAGVLIADGERKAPHGIPRRELAFEIGGPQIVGCRRDWGHHTGVPMRPPAAPPLDQARPGEQVARSADGRPGRFRDLWVPRSEPGQQLARPPIRMRPPRCTQQLGDRRGDAVRAVMRDMAAILQARLPLLVVTVQPFVARLPADSISGAEFCPRVESKPIVGDKASAEFHG